jgi:hypothetical protein
LRSLGHSLETRDDIERVCIHRCLEPEDLDKRLNGFWLAGPVGHLHRPQAKAFHLLKKLDLGAVDSS